MKSKLLFASAVLCLLMMITGVRPGSAQQVQPLDPEWLVQMYQDGWQKVQEGVLQRTSEEGLTETFTYGEEGLQFSIQKLVERASFLENEYSANPTEELGQALAGVRSQLMEARSKVGSVEAEPFGGGEELQNCDIAYGAHAYATYLTGSAAPGVRAQADAYFHSNCGHYGYTDAYAYSKATIGTTETIKSQQDPKNYSSWIDSYATSTVNGGSNCYSWAYGRSWSYQLGFDYYTEAPANYSCPPPPPSPPTVSVSGPSNVYTDYYNSCTSVTWTASVSGGTPGYSINWYIGSTFQGSGTQFSQTYCSHTGYVTVTAMVSDSASQSAQASFSTYFSHDPYSGGGGGCDPYSCYCLQSDPNNPQINRPIDHCYYN